MRIHVSAEPPSAAASRIASSALTAVRLFTTRESTTRDTLRRLANSVTVIWRSTVSCRGGLCILAIDFCLLTDSNLIVASPRWAADGGKRGEPSGWPPSFFWGTRDSLRRVSEATQLLIDFDAVPYPSPFQIVRSAHALVPAAHDCSEGIHWPARRISHVAKGIICERRRDEGRIAIRLLLGHIRGPLKTRNPSCRPAGDDSQSRRSNRPASISSWNRPGSGV
jgi:hypothetical protein